VWHGATVTAVANSPFWPDKLVVTVRDDRDGTERTITARRDPLSAVTPA
jgi:hypothetical protein